MLLVNENKLGYSKEAALILGCQQTEGRFILINQGAIAGVTFWGICSADIKYSGLRQ